jgi:hypothetical protein
MKHVASTVIQGKKQAAAHMDAYDSTLAETMIGALDVAQIALRNLVEAQVMNEKTHAWGGGGFTSK